VGGWSFEAWFAVRWRATLKTTSFIAVVEAAHCRKLRAWFIDVIKTRNVRFDTVHHLLRQQKVFALYITDPVYFVF